MDEDGNYDDATGPTPSYTWPDNYEGNVGLRVTDNEDITDTDLTTVTIINVPPTVDAGPDQAILPAQTFQVNATFTDPGTLDTHSATIDFDDGAGPQPATVDQEAGAGVLTGSKTYLGPPATYEIEVCVTDDDSGMDCDSLTLLVEPGRPTDPGPPENPGPPDDRPGPPENPGPPHREP